MKNKSDLQETYETRIYNLNKKFDTYQVVEFFLFTAKRSSCFPSVYTRKGTQTITLYKNSTAVAETTNLDVLESATERKKLIFNFLREKLKSLKDFECTLRKSEK